MKTVLSLLFIGLASSLFAQKQFSEEFTFNKTSTDQAYEVPIPAGAKKLDFQLKASLEEGQIKVRLLDPEGEKHGGFELGSQETGTNSATSIRSTGKAGRNSNISTNSNTNGTATTISSSGHNSSSSSTNSQGSTTTISSTSSDEGEKKSYSYSYQNVSSNEKGAKGQMDRKMVEPLAGTWKVIIEATDATGQVEVSFNLRD